MAIRAEFSKHMTPALALVGGVGMNPTARKEWLASAYSVIGDVPSDILGEAAKEAMRKADHPSKIVPLICTAVDRIVATRSREAARQRATQETLETTRRYRQPHPDAAEVGGMMKDLLRRMTAKN